MSRRSAGEGSIVRRADGRWMARLQVDGVRQVVYGKTRTEAANKLNEVKRQAAQAGALPDDGRHTLNDLLDAWLQAVIHRLRPTTVEHYALLAETYLRPSLGELPLRKVSPQRVQRLYASMQEEGHHRTAQLVACVLRQALELGVRWNWVAFNAAKRTLAPTWRPQRKAVWSVAEFSTFLRGAEAHTFWPLWAFILATGCRLGEALGLVWDCVDLERGSVDISHTLVRVGGEYRLQRPKTQAGERTVTLPLLGLEALQRQRAEQDDGRSAVGTLWPLVFPGATGNPLHRSTVAHALRRECERLGLPPLSPHGMRHQHASLLLAQRLPIPDVSQRLGHANSAITMSTYAHALHQSDKAASQAIERAVRGRD